ncbi:peptide ABC transporter substrate-binding protein [bacterium SCSIO 12696]|nr:peptide ABC transporter substrate-binding protein [bacterium SCSIO 12696]
MTIKKSQNTCCKIFALAMVLSGLSTFSVASSSDSADKKHFRIGISQYPTSVHRSFFRQTVAKYALNFTLRQPVYFDNQGQLQCNSCISVPTLENGQARVVNRENGERGIAVTFRIKPDARWGDGTPVTADDFKLYWEIGRHPDTGANRSSWFKSIEKFEVIDDRAFTLYYKNAAYGYNNISDLFPINSKLERPIFESDPGNYRNNTLYKTEPTNVALWSGPYVLKSLTTGKEFILARNPHWQGKRPQFDEIALKVIENTSMMEANLLSGAVDMIGFGLQADQGISFEKRHSRNYQVVYAENVIVEYMDVNLDNRILADVRVRRALLHALNRDQANQLLFDGKQPPAIGIRPGENFERQYQFDPERAIALLNEAGWTTLKKGIRHNSKGEPLQLEIATASGNKTRELLQQWMQGQFKQVGIDLRIRNQTARVFFGETRKKRLFTGLSLQSGSVYPYWTYRNIFHSSAIPTPENNYSGYNRGGYKSAEMDRLIEVQEAALLETEFRQAELAIEELINEDLPSYLMFWKPRVTVIPRNLKGFRTPRFIGTSYWAEEWRWE